MAGKPFKPNEIDVYIGQTIARLRRRQGLSQKDLAATLGVSFQQIQKYEVAANRISASSLYRILKALEVSFAAVFTELGRDMMYDAKMRRAINALWLLNDDDKKIVYKLIWRLGDGLPTHAQ